MSWQEFSFCIRRQICNEIVVRIRQKIYFYYWILTNDSFFDRYLLELFFGNFDPKNHREKLTSRMLWLQHLQQQPLQPVPWLPLMYRLWIWWVHPLVHQTWLLKKWSEKVFMELMKQTLLRHMTRPSPPSKMQRKPSLKRVRPSCYFDKFTQHFLTLLLQTLLETILIDNFSVIFFLLWPPFMFMNKGKYTALLSVLVVGSFIIPMAQYFWYVKEDDSSDRFFASKDIPEPEPPKKKGWF